MNNSFATPEVHNSNTTEVSIFDDPYRKDALEHNWQHGKLKTMQALLTIGFVLLVSNVIAFAAADALVLENIISLLLMPLLFLGLGLFAKLQPLIAIVSGIAVILLATVLNYISLGPASLIAGWIYKVLCLYFLLKGFRHAREAEEARKELRGLNSESA